MSTFTGNIFVNSRPTRPTIQQITASCTHPGTVFIDPSWNGNFTFTGGEDTECELVTCTFTVVWVDDCGCGNSTVNFEFHPCPENSTAVPRCLVVEETPCSNFAASCGSLFEPAVDCSEDTPVLEIQQGSSEFTNQSCIDGVFLRDAIAYLAEGRTLTYATNCSLFYENTIPGGGGSVAIIFRFTPEHPVAQIRIWDDNDLLIGRLDLQSPCTSPYDISDQYEFSIVSAFSENNCWDLSEPPPTIRLNPDSRNSCT